MYDKTFRDVVVTIRYHQQESGIPRIPGTGPDQDPGKQKTRIKKSGPAAYFDLIIQGPRSQYNQDTIKSIQFFKTRKFKNFFRAGWVRYRPFVYVLIA
jgi:hypothetical protein